jgi:folate-binding protein YgfZ
LLITENPAAASAKIIEQRGASLSTSEYDLKRFAEGFAQYPTEINDSIILTEARVRDAVSFQKGCYVGQEVIERSDAIGKLPRHLERIVVEGSESLQPQVSVLDKDAKPIGKIMSAISDVASNKTFAFALLKTGAYAPHDHVQCEGRVGAILSPEEKQV